MTSHRLAVTLTALNLVLLLGVMAQDRVAHAASPLGVLRGRALELVDDQGRVRAEIRILPADPTVKMPDGSVGYPEGVQLRLIDSKGSPHVKLGALEDGSGLVLGGESRAYTQLLSRGGRPFVKIVDSSGKEQVIRP
ncbi:MAG: hypothetical protein JF589_14980 [Gemmatimonadetes bacterium]|nr:hypothetical protein [Gemmatimonadota bacterium]